MADPTTRSVTPVGAYEPGRVVASLRELAARTGGPDGSRRLCWTPEWLEARALLRESLATLPVDGGVPTLLGLPAIAIASWSPDGQSVVYVDAQDGVLNLWSRALDGGTPRKLTNFTSDIVFWFAFSRDGRRLALARGTGSSDVVVLARK